MSYLASRSKPISRFLISRSPSSPSRILCISLFSTSSGASTSPGHQNYSSTSGSVLPSPSRWYDEESKSVRVSVWWDIENCSVPTGVNVFKITQAITSAVRANGIKGPVQVTAFGDILCLSRGNQEALSSTGVNLVHIPSGGKNSADRSLLVDLMYWISQNPPPAHIFLISGDRDFAGILHKLRMNNYNVLLAGKDGKQTPAVLCSAASIMWHWNELANGENLSGRHFNQPPDGPYNSWYGQYRGTLEDPYEGPEQKSYPVADNSSKADVSSESRYRPGPMVILRHIRRIVNAHPKGLTISELKSELTKVKVLIDKDFYGHKKFSRLLLSIPHIVKVVPCPDSRFLLHPVNPRVQKPERNDTTVGSKTEKKNQDVQVTRKANGQTHTDTRMVDGEPLLPVSPCVDCIERTMRKRAVKETPEKMALDVAQEDNKVASAKELLGKETFNAELVETPMTPKEKQSSEKKTGIWKRLWFGTGINAQETSNDVPGERNTSSGSPEMSTPNDEGTILANQHGGQCIVPSSTDKSEASPGFFRRVISWWKSWVNSSVKTSTEQSREEPVCVEENSWIFDNALHSSKHELFSKDTFWSDLQSFLKTPRGSDIVSKSSSRQQIRERLQKEGPMALRPLQKIDLHHLLFLLVSEKKWIAEFPTKTPRFKIIHPPLESSTEIYPQNVQPHSPIGPSLIFQNSSTQENPQSGVSPALCKKPSENSRREVLRDCQKLLDELLSQQPEGFNMGIFKKRFHDKYGYSLDYQKLGYPKLVSLLQIMHGVKIESSSIYPDSAIYSPGIKSLGLTEKSGSDGDVSDTSWKKEDGESPWEELEPVATQEREFSLGKENCNYEPSVTDDEEFSELGEDETSSPVAAEDQNSCSSLLQILDSWYGTKDESEPRDHGSHAEGSEDCSKEETELPQSSTTSVQDEAAAVSTSAVNHARKQKPQLSYLFVSDPNETKKDKLIEGILGSLKNSGDLKVQE